MESEIGKDRVEPLLQRRRWRLFDIFLAIVIVFVFSCIFYFLMFFSCFLFFLKSTGLHAAAQMMGDFLFRIPSNRWCQNAANVRTTGSTTLFIREAAVRHRWGGFSCKQIHLSQVLLGFDPLPNSDTFVASRSQAEFRKPEPA